MIEFIIYAIRITIDVIIILMILIAIISKWSDIRKEFR